jgi:hypothetical protein
MRTTYTLIFIILLSLKSFGLSLSEAIADKKVMVDWTGSDYSTMPEAIKNSGFYPKMQMVITNQTNAPLTVNLDEGYLLQPNEEGYQAMLITQQIALDCPAKRQQKQLIYAMCTQLSHSGPGVQTHYKLGQKASPALLQLAQYIRMNNYQNNAAQQAVWSLTDRSPVLGIESSNEAVKNGLQGFVAQLMGTTLEKITSQEQRNKTALLQEFNGNKVDRNITFTADSITNVSVGFYDMDNHLIEPIFANRDFQKGDHSIRYNPFPVKLREKNYTVKMIRDGELYREYFFRQ